MTQSIRPLPEDAAHSPRRPDGDLDTLSVVEAAAAVAAGRVSATELMEAVLDRARRTEPLVHGYVHLDEDAALAAAGEADRRQAEQGAAGPLQGVPVGVKDLIATADMPTSAGSRLLAGHRPTADAEVVRRLRRAGAVVVGKQWTHEFGCGMDEPPTRNPWDLTRYPGGSTAGGGVSVAVGSSMAAIGTDGGGSIRKPAAINGLVGLKPTRGLISTDGVIPGTTSLDHIGWLTRSVADAALLLDVLAGGEAPRGPVTPGLGTADGPCLGGMRLGCPTYFFQALDPAIKRLTDRCLDALENAGAIILDLDIPELDLAPEAHGTLMAAESYALHARRLAESADLYHPRTRRSLQAGEHVFGHEVAAAQQTRQRVEQAVAAAFEHHALDALCGPTVAIPAVPMDEMDPVRMLPAYCRLTLPFNLTGHPALSVPCGMSPAGLPAGFQIAARPYEEATALRCAATVEAAGLWTSPRPTPDEG
ncbi:amidase [Streptomyces sp. NPDC056309]|uniref:amidase n=1 Tax=unclassified Streptomyces TaxID=2593676 RepID=UPI0035DE6A05